MFCGLQHYFDPKRQVARLFDEERSKAIDSSSGQEFNTRPYSIMPRRLWDLKSNRVLISKCYMRPPTFWAVSHSWTDDMSPVQSAISQHQWPIPLPKGINLDCLQSELLTLSAEYVWIDVVCLRQQSEADGLKQLQQQEWKLDIPTIGIVICFHLTL